MLHNKRAFNNYVDKKRGVRVRGKSKVGHKTKGSWYAHCTFLSTLGGLGSKLGELWST